MYRLASNRTEENESTKTRSENTANI